MAEWRVMDADGHINENETELNEFLGAPYGGKKRGFPAWPSLDGRFRSPDVTETNAEMWGSFLDSAHVDAAVIYPTSGLAHGLIQDAGWAVALASAYNDWMHAYYTSRDPRLYAVALLSPQDVGASVAELRRCVQDKGCVAGLLPAVTYDNAVFGKEKYWPLYEEAVRLGNPIVYHGPHRWGWVWSASTAISKPTRWSTPSPSSSTWSASSSRACWTISRP